MHTDPVPVIKKRTFFSPAATFLSSAPAKGERRYKVAQVTQFAINKWQDLKWSYKKRALHTAEEPDQKEQK